MQPKKRKRIEGIHIVQNKKSRRRNPSKKTTFLKNTGIFSRGKGHEQSFKEGDASKVFFPPPISLGQKWHVVQHKKFPQKLTITQKRRM